MTKQPPTIDPGHIVTWRKSTRSDSGGGSNCVEVGAWRKSSRSGSTGGQNCVEVGAWRKSIRSSGGGGSNCVEAGTCAHHGIAVRDSKFPQGGTLTATRQEWASLLHSLGRD